MQDFIKTLSDIFANGGPGTYIATGAFGFMLFCILVQAFCGFRKGYPRQTLKACFTLGAAVIAFIIVEVMCNSVFGIFDDMSVAEFITQIETTAATELPAEAKDILLELNPLVVEYIAAMIFSPIFAPIIFLVLFLVLNFIFRFFYHIVKWCFHIKKKKGMKNRLIGTLIGAVNGFIFAAILILPFTVFTDALNVVIEAEIEATGDEELETLYENDIKPTTDHAVFKTVKALGGNAVLNAFGTVKNNETKFNAREELFTIAEGVLTNVNTLTELDIENITEEDKAAIEDLVDLVKDSDFLSTILAEVLNVAADMLEEEAPADGETQAVIDAVIDIFRTSTKDTVAGDLDSIVDILFLLTDSGIMNSDENTDPGELLTKKDENGKTIIDKIIEIIDANPHFESLETALVKMSIEMLTEGTVSDEAYETIKGGFNDILAIDTVAPGEAGYDAYISEISVVINDALVAENITLESEVLDIMAEKVAEYKAENFAADKQELTDNEFNDLMLNYYDAYLEFAEANGGLTE